MAKSFKDWKKKALGRKIDVDKAFGDQCVDVAMDYAQYLFNKPWYQVIGYGNAKDIYGSSKGAYFKKIKNNPKDKKQLPKQGDLIVFDKTNTNPYGHIGVVDKASSRGVDLIQQDGFHPNGATFEKFRPWGTSPTIGWLRPKTSILNKVVQKVTPKKAKVPKTYIVHTGDNLTKIAKKFKTTVVKIAKLNKIKNPNLIKVGQKLKLK